MTRYHGFRKILSLLITFNILTYGILYFHDSKFDINALILGAITTILLCLTCVIIILNRLGDEYLFIIISMLISLGSAMVYRLYNDLLTKQIQWIIVGVILFFVTYIFYIKLYSEWSKYSKYYYLAILFLFFITIVFGEERNGAKNWLVLGPFVFQPSELIKILFVLFLAAFNSQQVNKPLELDENNKLYRTISDKLKMNSSIGKYIPKKIYFPKYLIPMFCVYSMIGLFVIQREWGAVLEFFIIYSIMVYVFEKGKAIMFIVFPNMVLAIFGSFFGYYLTPHIKTRVDIWLNPWADAHGKGYQIIRSIFAIGAGGFFGKGIGLGYPYTIPHAETDFIFSAICEEFGIFGGCAVILLYFILVYRGAKVSLAIKNAFQKKVAFGITVLFGIQTFIIIGGVIKMIPLTGITLPFISYGGSSLTTSFIALGILQAVSNKSYDKEDS